MNLDFKTNTIQTKWKALLGLIFLPILFFYWFTYFVPTFTSGGSAGFLLILVLTLVLLFFLVKITLAYIEFFLPDRDSRIISKSTTIKSKYYNFSSKGFTRYFYLKDVDNKTFEVDSKIYNAFNEGDKVVIEYLKFSKYLYRIALSNE